jgi:hypothetical protein
MVDVSRDASTRCTTRGHIGSLVGHRLRVAGRNRDQVSFSAGRRKWEDIRRPAPVMQSAGGREAPVACVVMPHNRNNQDQVGEQQQSQRQSAMKLERRLPQSVSVIWTAGATH